VRFAKIFTDIKIQMPKLKCQMNVKAQISKCLTPISIFDIFISLRLMKFRFDLNFGF